MFLPLHSFRSDTCFRRNDDSSSSLLCLDAVSPSRQRQAGFSYLWVLLLVAILGVGLTVVVELETTAAQRDKEKELLAIGRQFRTALGRYYEVQMVGGKHLYPATLEELLQDSRIPGVRRHLRKIFVDPMTGKAGWGVVKLGGRIVGVYSLSDKTPIKQDGFEADDLNFKGKEKYSDWKFTYPSNVLLRPDGAQNGNPNAPVGSLFPVEPVTPTGPAISTPAVTEPVAGTVVPLSEQPTTLSTQPGH